MASKFFALSSKLNWHDGFQGWNLTNYIVLLSFVVIFLVWFNARATYYRYPLPPGPKTSWFKGPASTSIYPWLTYCDWAKTYGDLVYYSTFGNSVLILNSYEAMSDLLEKRGDIYSSRPRRTMVVDVLGFDFLFTTMDGERWKTHRYLFHKYFGKVESDRYNSMQTKQINAFLRTILREPDNFRRVIRRAASVVLGLVYGHDVAEQGDRYVDLADSVVSTLSLVGIFGTFWVDYLPWLKYVPTWLPGAGWKRQAMVWRKSVRAFLDEPFDSVKQKMASGKADPCLVTTELEKLWEGEDDGHGINEEVVKNTAATAFAAGSDTSVSVVSSFFLVMTKYPEIQKQVREEVDRAVQGRLPTLSDRENLPLIRSLIYELLRWNPVGAIPIPHCANKTNIYRGYTIPKGTTVIINFWPIQHDPERYPDPYTFKADRFLERIKSGGIESEGVNPIPDSIVFGFGRRSCPGNFIALDFLFLMVTRILATFDISKAVGEDGEVIEPAVEYTNTFVRHPKPFPCVIRPRSSEAVSIIENTANEV